MADFETQPFGSGGGYTARHKGMDEGFMTPNFEYKEGMRHGPFSPAPYLPIVRSEKHYEDFIVISAGKAVACDSMGWLVPAGYKLLLAQGAGNGPQYTQLDIDMGILDAAGNTPAVNDYVIDAMLDEDMTVGHIAGAISYNVYLLSGRGADADYANPATYHFHNYNRQSGVAVLTDYLLEFPVEPTRRLEAILPLVTVGAGPANPFLVNFPVATVFNDSTLEVRVNNELLASDEFTFDNNGGPAGVDQLEIPDLVEGDEVSVNYVYDTGVYNAPFAGMATWKGSATPGGKVTCDEDSNWVMYVPGTVGDTSAGDESDNILAAIALTLDVVGQITKVDSRYPKQYLDRVKSAFDPRLTGKIIDGETGLELQLNRHPGSATNGLPHNIVFAGGGLDTGVVRFNLNVT